LRKNAVYAERVREKAVSSVYEDGMPFRRVTRRLARDFWVEPSEAMIRRWCQQYADGLDFESDYQRWVVEEFSGVLCVDEVYQDRLALLLAVDPASPDGDRLVGYELIHGRVERKDVEDFLSHLKRAGIEPDEIITDGSPLYPGSLKEVWPQAAHQLCLFHETRLVTGEIYKARAALRKSVPKPPPTFPQQRLLGRPRKCPIPEKLAAHRQAIARVYALHEQGVSIRGIRRRTGHSRNTIKRWLRGEIPKEIAGAELPTAWMLDEIFGERVSEQEEKPLTPEVPSPWSSWEQVRKVRNLLWDVRYVILRRPDHLTERDREKLDFLFESPIGEQVQSIRGFLEEWYLLLHDEQHEQRTLAEAKERYDRLKNNPDYQKLKHLAGLQARFCEEHFLKISRFLEHAGWEATNNGVERTGRTFRYLQRSRYNFRKPASIEDAIKARAHILRKESPPAGEDGSLPGRCVRGRKARRLSGAPVAA
jgi:transposase